MTISSKARIEAHPTLPTMHNVGVNVNLLGRFLCVYCRSAEPINSTSTNKFNLNLQI